MAARWPGNGWLQEKPDRPYQVLDSSHDYKEAEELFHAYRAKLVQFGQVDRFGIHMFRNRHVFQIAIVDREKEGKLVSAKMRLLSGSVLSD